MRKRLTRLEAATILFDAMPIGFDNGLIDRQLMKKTGLTPAQFRAAKTGLREVLAGQLGEPYCFDRRTRRYYFAEESVQAEDYEERTLAELRKRLLRVQLGTTDPALTKFGKTLSRRQMNKYMTRLLEDMEEILA